MTAAQQANSASATLSVINDSTTSPPPWHQIWRSQRMS
jgi:hypothetical protein